METWKNTLEYIYKWNITVGAKKVFPDHLRVPSWSEN